MKDLDQLEKTLSHISDEHEKMKRESQSVSKELLQSLKKSSSQIVISPKARHKPKDDTFDSEFDPFSGVAD